jgi:hypothetical protein
MTQTIDLRKTMSEAKRMASGEIAYDEDYLMELAEYDGDETPDFQLSLVCDCGGALQFIDCPECDVLPRDDCPLCEGNGVFLDCFECE